MEINNPQHKSFLWHLDIEPFTWKTCYGEQCPSFVTEENKEVWGRYLEKLIKKHLKAEVMNSPEFREIETMVGYEKLVGIKNDEQRKRMMETAVLGWDGATEDQLYSQRAECGL